MRAQTSVILVMGVSVWVICSLFYGKHDEVIDSIVGFTICRLQVACTCKQLKEFVYEHHELWSTISVVAEKESKLSRSPSALGLHPAHPKRHMNSSGYRGALRWTAERKEVRRLRVVLHDEEAEARMVRSRKSQKNLQQLLQESTMMRDEWEGGSPMQLLVNTASELPSLISLAISAPAYSNDLSFELLPRLIPALNPNIKQIVLTSSDMLKVPNSLRSLRGLVSLSLESSTGGGVSLAAESLPSGLKHLKIGGLLNDMIPEALSGVEGLESLDINWAVDDDKDQARTPDFSVLSQKQPWCTRLKRLSLGYFEASSLPDWLPESLTHLELQWNLKTCMNEDSKQQLDVDVFHRSFDCLIPLKQLVHLNLNNFIGQWGIPEAVCALSQLEYLGVVSARSDLLEAPVGQGTPVAPPIQRGRIAATIAKNFPNLKRLDIEIYEASIGARELTALKYLERLRLGRGESPETYVRLDVKDVVGRGLIFLLPSLPNLTEVQTEGMLLPATASCGRWNRLLGFEAEELRAQASAAVKCLQDRGVALSRWYAWPFAGGSSSNTVGGIKSWDTVV